jgi:hypothetical protein
LASDARVGISIECSTCSTRQLAYWQHRSSRRCVEPQRTSISPQDKEESNMGRSAVSAAAVCAFFCTLAPWLERLTRAGEHFAETLRQRCANV